MAALILVAAAAVIGQFSLLRSEEPARLTDLTVAKAEPIVFKGQNGIKITFDVPSGDRIRQFTRDLAGRHIVILVNQQKLATTLLLAPIVNGSVMVTGDLDSFAGKALSSAGAVVTLEVESPEPGK